jgi:hypothetical protein
VAYSPPSCGASKGHDRPRDRPRHGPTLEFDIDELNLTGRPMSDDLRAGDRGVSAQLRPAGGISSSRCWSEVEGADDGDRTVRDGRSNRGRRRPVRGWLIPRRGYRRWRAASMPGWELGGHGTDDRAKPSWSAGSTAQSRTMMTPAGGGGWPRRVAGGGRALTASRRWRCGRSGSLGRRRRSPPANRADPYTDRAHGTLMPVARNRTRFIEIVIRLRQIAVRYLRPENRPFRLDRRVPTQNL